MKAISINKILTTLIIIAGGISSCNEIDIPNHQLDVEFRYELTCSDVLLDYVIPEVTIEDGTGAKHTMIIDGSMWEGVDHKKWDYSVHYDSLNVMSTMTVKYTPKTGVTYHDESEFDNVHNLSCLIIVQEDGDGKRNDYTIVPDFPSVTSVSAEALRNYIGRLINTTTMRGGIVDMKGEVTKIENDK